MRISNCTRRWWSVTALSVAGLTVLVFGDAAVAPALADAETFRANCAKCHPRATTIAQRVKGDTADARKSALDAFLSKHHAENPEVRERIVAYLITLPTK